MGDVLGYARVSTGDQDVAGQTIRLEQAGAIRVFTDVKSGKSMDRPGLAELLAFSRKGDTLAVVRLDRLGRSLTELLSIVERLKERGVALLSLEEKIDTSSAAGELVFHVFGAIAHLGSPQGLCAKPRLKARTVNKAEFLAIALQRTQPMPLTQGYGRWSPC